MLVEGQVRGGTVQGLGGILCEAIEYDTAGQLLTGTLMDYALPAAVANAVCDALAPFAVEINATPIKPEHLVRAVKPRPA